MVMVLLLLLVAVALLVLVAVPWLRWVDDLVLPLRRTGTVGVLFESNLPTSNERNGMVRNILQKTTMMMMMIAST